jgi:hypothetical protein
LSTYAEDISTLLYEISNTLDSIEEIVGEYGASIAVQHSVGSLRTVLDEAVERLRDALEGEAE